MKIDWDASAKDWQELVAQGRAWDIVVPEWLPMSLNDLVRNSWNTYAGERRWIQHFLSTHYRVVPPAMGVRGIQMVIVKVGGQWDDKPNLDGRSKATIDAMKRLGMIRDDNAKWLDWHHVIEVHGKFKGTLVRLWEAE